MGSAKEVGLPFRTQTTGSPPFFLRDIRASETRARVKITPREKRRHAVVIFMRARVSLALLSLRKNGGLLVVYFGPEPRTTFLYLFVILALGLKC